MPGGVCCGLKNIGLRSPLIWCALAALVAFPAVAPAADTLAIDVANAELAYDNRTSRAIVTFVMTESSREAFAQFTARNVGRQTDFRVDGRTVMKPVIREPIRGGHGQISGGFTVDEARDIADRLMSGAAKIEIEIVPDEPGK